jgi:nucleoside phosphorylase
MNPILILTASRIEYTAIAHGLGLGDSAPNRGSIRSCEWQGTVFSLLHSGMGLTPTKKALQSIPDPPSYTAILTIGYCGGLTSEAGSGQTILYRKALLWDPEDLPPISFSADQDLLRVVSDGMDRLSIAHLEGQGLTVNRIVSQREEKKLLGGRWGCLAVDMESAVVYQIAEEYRIPCLAIRVVLDGFDQPLPDFSGKITPQGNLIEKPMASLEAKDPSPTNGTGAHWKEMEKKTRIHLQKTGGLLPYIFRR